MAKRGVTQEEYDSAQRLADAVNLHVTVSRESGRETPGYVAVKLEDGRAVDGVLYDTRADAVRHNKDDPYAFYVKVGKDSMPVREALIVLQMARMAKKRGIVFAEEEVITPQLPELMRPFIPRTLDAAGLVGRRAMPGPPADIYAQNGLILPDHYRN